MYLIFVKLQQYELSAAVAAFIIFLICIRWADCLNLWVLCNRIELDAVAAKQYRRSNLTNAKASERKREGEEMKEKRKKNAERKEIVTRTLQYTKVTVRVERAADSNSRRRRNSSRRRRHFFFSHSQFSVTSSRDFFSSCVFGHSRCSWFLVYRPILRRANAKCRSVVRTLAIFSCDLFFVTLFFFVQFSSDENIDDKHKVPFAADQIIINSFFFFVLVSLCRLRKTIKFWMWNYLCCFAVTEPAHLITTK